MTVIESIIKNLETLPASKLVEVAHFISGLNPKRTQGANSSALRLRGESGPPWPEQARVQGLAGLSARLCPYHIASVGRNRTVR